MGTGHLEHSDAAWATPVGPVAPAADRMDADKLRLIELMPDALLLFDEQARVTYCNRAARILAQVLSPGDAGGARALLRDWHPQLVPEHAMEVCRERGSWVGEVELETANRSSRVLAIRLQLLGEAEETSRFGLSARDATVEHGRQIELNQRNLDLEIALAKLGSAQEAVLRSEKLASIGQLAAGVAHEINNPIAYVKSNLNSLQHSTLQLLSEVRAKLRGLPAGDRDDFDIDEIAGEIRELIAESSEGVDRVIKIVRDLKDFSHIDRIENWVLADIHAGLESTLNIIWNELKYKVALHKHYGQLPLVQCLPSELNQVFMNILLNASHAIVERGNITITTGVGEEEVFIAIEDDGGGIPEDIQQRIFDPFFTTKPVGSGTGLGLSISYGIVKKHNGRIELTSTPGQGACFRIVLPIRQPGREGA